MNDPNLFIKRKVEKQLASMTNKDLVEQIDDGIDILEAHINLNQTEKETYKKVALVVAALMGELERRVRLK